MCRHPGVCVFVTIVSVGDAAEVFKKPRTHLNKDINQNTNIQLYIFFDLQILSCVCCDYSRCVELHTFML